MTKAYNNLTLPLANCTSTEIAKTLDLENANYSFFEIWLETILDLDCTDLTTLFVFLDQICSLIQPDRFILISRTKDLSLGKITPISAKRIFEYCSEKKIIIDLDSSQKLFLDQITTLAPGYRLLLSYHNYQKTPEYQDLKQILQEMDPYRPYIKKIATFCQNPRDALLLLNLRLEIPVAEKAILIGMGEHGVITRIFASLWGNYLNFCSAESTMKTAPGQLTRTDLEQIFSLLRGGQS